eukprot:8727833-Pyramimonas_sp.AAC.1
MDADGARGGHAIGEEVKMQVGGTIAGNHGLTYFGDEVCRVMRLPIGQAPQRAGEQPGRLQN